MEEQTNVVTNLSFKKFVGLKLAVNTSELLFKRISFNIPNLKLFNLWHIVS